jgi:LPS-assembly lipoprotein
LKKLLILAFATALAACGFHLRGSADMPFDSVYVPGATGGIALDLSRNLRAGSNVKVVDDPKQAEAILEFSGETRVKQILSLTGSGRVGEFRLRYRVAFRVHDGKGNDFVPLSTLELTRDVTYSDADVLAKESEEQLLYRDMQGDMVQQIIRRMSSAQKPKA